MVSLTGTGCEKREQRFGSETVSNVNRLWVNGLMDWEDGLSDLKDGWRED